MSRNNDRDDRDDDRDCDGDSHGGGRNNKASISGDTTASVTEDSGRYTVTGDLDVQDRDRGEDAMRAVSSKQGKYGTFSIDSRGQWTYKLDNGRAATQALDKGEKAYDSFEVFSKDGSASKTIKVTVNGADEKPQSDGRPVIGGTATGSVTEDAPAHTSTGKLTIDGKQVASGFESTTKAGAFGTFKLNANGSWTYTLDNSKANVQALNGGQSVTESFVVKSKAIDGRCGDDDVPSVSKTIVITVNGTDEAGAVIGGTLLGSVVEDGNAQSSATGQLTITGGVLQAVTGLAGSYGTLSLNAAGQWDYVLDNSKASVQALALGETVTDTLTVSSVSGVTRDIAITVRGTNDAPVAADDREFVSFESGYAPIDIDVLANDTDVDHGAVLHVAGLPATSTLGALLTLNPDGTVHYAHPGIPTGGNPLTDTFTYQAVDEHGAVSVATVTVELTGNTPQ